MLSRLRQFNFKGALKGDLFATGLTFSGQTLVKLGSSLILTRILAPAAYGTIAILVSVVFILALLSDTGFSVCIVRSPRGEDASYLNTAWTIRILRAAINAIIMFTAAPFLAQLYHAPTLIAPFRVLALWFIIDGFASTSFPVAIRRKRARVLMYSEFLGSFVAAIFTVVYCYFSRDFWGMLYGLLVNRAVAVGMSHLFYREMRPRIQWDWAAAKDIFEYTRFVMPSSAITVFLQQFDRIIFLRLFDFRLLGIYGLAGNIANPVEQLITRASRMVLYPRCAHNFRTDRGTFSVKYYLENTNVFMATLAIPAALGGAAHFLIRVLYDPRYAEAAEVLQAFMVRAVLQALASTAEDMLVATGESRLILVGNVYRVVWILAASFIGYHFYGFLGFTYGVAVSGVPALTYYFWLQRKKGLLIARYELYKVAFAFGVAVCAYAAGTLLLTLMPGLRIRA